MVDGRSTTDDGRRADDGACLYYKLTNEPKGSGELKKKEFISNTQLSWPENVLMLKTSTYTYTNNRVENKAFSKVLALL